MTNPKRGRPSRAELPEIIERERRVIELRRAGATFDEIARQVGYTAPGTAYDAYKRALDRTLQMAGSEECRSQELDRLDRLQVAVWPSAMRGDEKAVANVLRIMDRRARLLGLDAPIKHEMLLEVADPTSIDAEVARLAAMLGEQEPAQ
jgi:hypothetical protein